MLGQRHGRIVLRDVEDRVLLPGRVWPVKKRARIEVGKWIEDRYNRRRRHASIGQISPVDFELQYSCQIADFQQAA
jgi:transposase InsO family protein